MSLKLGNSEEKEDPQKAKEKGIIERIKMKYKSENKRQADENDENEIKRNKKIKKAKIDEENKKEDITIEDKIVKEAKTILKASEIDAKEHGKKAKVRFRKYRLKFQPNQV